MSEDVPKKKRQYSRNGCRDCKKRKLKCDELHPACGQCQALNRNCIYEKLIKFNNSRIFTIESKGEKLVNLKEEKSEGVGSGSKKRKKLDSSPLNPLNNQFLLQNDMNSPLLNTTQHPELYNELLNDASSLINDLNELINSDSPFFLSDSNDFMPGKEFNYDDDFLIHDPVIPKQVSNHTLNDFKISDVLDSSISQTDIVNISNFFQLSISSSHVNYLKTFVTKVHINLMPFSTAYLHNAFINNILIQAKKSPYLLSAILAISARYEYYRLFKMNNKTNTNLQIHGRLRSYYLSSCLNSLDLVLEKKNEIVNNIESLLFTTLILACDFSSSTGSNWRAHLRGAKDLLLKYSNYTSVNNVSLLISKTIFSSMEMLAAMTVSIGGTIHNSKELNELLNLTDTNYGKYLSYYGLALDAKYCDDEDGIEHVIPHTYNIYFGHSNEATHAFKEIILSLELIRRAKSETNLSLEDHLEDSKFKSMIEIVEQRPQLCVQQTLKVFALLQKLSNVYIITKKAPFLIQPDSKYHPLNSSKSSIVAISDKIPVSCYFHNEMNDNWYSWYDLCHQTYVDAAMLRFLLADKIFAMRSSSSSAQLLLRKIISSLFFIEIKKYSKEEERELVEYYGLLDDNDKIMINSLTTKGDEQEQPQHQPHDGADSNNDDEESDNPLDLINDSDKDDENSSSSFSRNPSSTPPPSSSSSSHQKQQNSDQSQQKFIKKKLQVSKYLNTQFDHRIIMIQWPLLICGICAYRAIDKLIIETCFDQMISYGIGSAEISLSKIKKNWLLSGISYGDKISDNLFWDDGDSVPFS